MCIPWPVWGGCLRFSTKWKLVTKVLVVALVSDKLRQLPVVCTEDTLSAITSTPGLLFFLNVFFFFYLWRPLISVSTIFKFHFHSFPLARCAKTQKHQYCWCVVCFGLFFLLIWVTLHTLCSRQVCKQVCLYKHLYNPSVWEHRTPRWHWAHGGRRLQRLV